MTGADFVALFRGYWPNARNVAAPKQQEMWADTLYGIPDDVVAYGMLRYARSAEHPPTVLQFERFIWPLMDAWSEKNPMHSLSQQWRARMRKLSEAEADHSPPQRRACETCGTDIRFDALPPHKRFSGDGGLVFRQHAGQWYAACCPQCGGPELRRVFARRTLRNCPMSLPLPRAADLESGAWKPVRVTPGGPLLAVARGVADTLKLAFASQWKGGPSRLARRVHPAWDAYFDWVEVAIRNTRAVIEADAGSPWDPPAREPGDDRSLESTQGALALAVAPPLLQIAASAPASPPLAPEDPGVIVESDATEPYLGDAPPF